jgi:hypothetical protein
LFKRGSEFIDFQPYVEKKCLQKGFKKQTLDPDKKCVDRYKLFDNGTLAFDRDSPRRHQTFYQTNEFCFEINGKATNKDEHFPSICVDTRNEMSRLT